MAGKTDKIRRIIFFFVIVTEYCIEIFDKARKQQQNWKWKICHFYLILLKLIFITLYIVGVWLSGQHKFGVI